MSKEAFYAEVREMRKLEAVGKTYSSGRGVSWANREIDDLTAERDALKLWVEEGIKIIRSYQEFDCPAGCQLWAERAHAALLSNTGGE